MRTAGCSERCSRPVARGAGDALRASGDMFWEVLWPLVLGFALSGAIQAVVSHRSMARLLGDDSPLSLSLATLFGVASSSCSYASVAIARSIFRKGASFIGDGVQLASTNLVIEPGYHPRRLARLAVRRRRVYGWDPDGCFHRRHFPADADAQIDRDGADPGRARGRREDGRPRWHGHERDRRVAALQAREPSRFHCDESLLRDGLGLGLDGHPVGVPDRRRAGCLGT